MKKTTRVKTLLMTVATSGLMVAPLLAQEDASAAQTAITTGITAILAAGGAIAAAAIGIFVAKQTVRTIKGFFSAGK